MYLAAPIYWLISLSLRTNQSIVGDFSVFPTEVTFNNYLEIFSNPVWYSAFGNSLTYVAINTVISVVVALPAAYAFSRYRFIGDKHLFFWLLSNRMAPPAVFLLPFFQLYSAVGLFDTPLAVALAHCLFTVPLAVWILEGFMSSVPRSLDDMARIDGHSVGFFFIRIFLPVIRSGIGVTVFFCFMFSWETAGGVCVLALPVHRRQAPVLLVAEQPHGAARGFPAALLSALLGGGSVRYTVGGGAGPLPVYGAAGRVDT